MREGGRERKIQMPIINKLLGSDEIADIFYSAAAEATARRRYPHWWGWAHSRPTNVQPCPNCGWEIQVGRIAAHGQGTANCDKCGKYLGEY